MRKMGISGKLTRRDIRRNKECSESQEPQHKRILDCEGSQTRVPVEPDVIQYLRGRTGRRTRERTGWGHSGRRKKGSRIITEHGKDQNSSLRKKKEQKETKKREMGKARIRRSGQDKTPRVHTAEMRSTYKTGKREQQ
ncbi:uncharacterized protein LOC143303895 [Bombus vancouverensis nearcticus]|uniref:uncharacterized protein LOC143303895 n=1 Tax=Bombus vancouverensis nearcticus TaxID=2705178 RepID=UPI00402B8EE5